MMYNFIGNMLDNFMVDKILVSAETFVIIEVPIAAWIDRKAKNV